MGVVVWLLHTHLLWRNSNLDFFGRFIEGTPILNFSGDLFKNITKIRCYKKVQNTVWQYVLVQLFIWISHIISQSINLYIKSKFMFNYLIGHAFVDECVNPNVNLEVYLYVAIFIHLMWYNLLYIHYNRTLIHIQVMNSCTSDWMLLPITKG